ncbi:hypothetical protein ABT317_04570 [Streptomyces carpinensis]|uniref:Uncharacterized protein n=1 Tax=Streptomyces carpinensis TaxID=66369 RepID=A0ABV1VWL8_9ACTN
MTTVPLVLLETDVGLTGVGLGSHRGLDEVFPAIDGEDPRAVSALYANPLAHAAAGIPNHLATEVQDLSFPEGVHADQEFEDGNIILGESPGLGPLVDEDAIAALMPSAGRTGPESRHVRPESAGKRMLGASIHVLAGDRSVGVICR